MPTGLVHMSWFYRHVMLATYELNIWESSAKRSRDKKKKKRVPDGEDRNIEDASRGQIKVVLKC